MKRALAWVLGIGLLVCGVGTFGYLRWRATGRAEDDRLFQEQVRLARQEGVPVTVDDYAALIPTAKPEENAADLYRKLDEHHLSTTRKISQAIYAVNARQKDAEPDAEKLLSECAGQLELVDKAAARPRCWFNRDWSLGSATLTPEFAPMRSAARLLILRGSLSAAHGKVQNAISDFRRALTIARHVSEEPDVIPHLVGEGIRLTAVQTLMWWSFRNPSEAAYRQETDATLAGFHEPDYQRECALELVDVLAMIELSQSPEGIKKLGLKDDDLPPASGLMAALAPAHAKARILEVNRKLWQLIKAFPPDFEDQADKLYLIRNEALFAYPLAARLVAALGTEGPVHSVFVRRMISRARLVQFRAMERALSVHPTPKSIKTDDLLSPFDGKPAIYRFDGQQISIEVSGFALEGKPTLMKLPPDPPKAS